MNYNKHVHKSYSELLKRSQSKHDHSKYKKQEETPIDLEQYQLEEFLLFEPKSQLLKDFLNE